MSATTISRIIIRQQTFGKRYFSLSRKRTITKLWSSTKTCRPLSSLSTVCREFLIDRKKQTTKDVIIMGNKQTTSTYLFSSLATDHDDTSELASGGTTIPFLLADIGEGIAEVELLQWFVEEGEHVNQFDRVCEVQSDKATVEISSRYDGIVTSLDNNKVGDMIKVGTPLLYINTTSVSLDNNSGSDNGVPTVPNEQQQSQTLNNIDDEKDKLRIPNVASKFHVSGDDIENNNAERVAAAQEDDFGPLARTMKTTAATTTGKVLATPAVRKLGMDYNIDLSTIAGTGPKGRVLKSDVLQLLKDSGRYDGIKERTKMVQQETIGAISREQQQEDDDDELETTIVPIRGYNRLMIKSMTASLQIPQMVYSDEINMTQLRAYRKELSNDKSLPRKISYLPFVVKSISLSLNDYPVINSTLSNNSDGDYSLLYHKNHNIGIAMDTPRGLAVPVIKNCQKLSVLDLCDELHRLQQAATEGSLSEDDISSATFTISNIGTIGGTVMTPIVTPPQVGIGAMGKIQRLPRFVQDDSLDVEEAYIMNMSWGGDHRVIDGATMARFSEKFKSYMENPMSMILTMK